MRLERRLAQSIAATCPGCSAFSSLVVYPGDPGEIVCLLRASLESWEVASSHLVAESNALAETAARSDEIIAVCGDYRGPISPAQRVQLALTLRWSWRVQFTQVGRGLLDQRKRPFCESNCPQMRTDPPSNSDGNPKAIPAIVSGVGDSI